MRDFARQRDECVEKTRVVVASIAALAVVCVPFAQATSHEAPTLDELIAQSDLIVHATVVTTSVHPAGPNGQPGIHTRVDLEVHEVLRGTAGTTLEVWVQGGRLGDRMRVVVGQARFEPLEEVVLFLFRDPNGALWPAGMGAGRWSVTGVGGGATVDDEGRRTTVDVVRARLRGGE